jgi:hypothetical protein
MTVGRLPNQLNLPEITASFRDLWAALDRHGDSVRNVSLTLRSTGGFGGSGGTATGTPIDQAMAALARISQDNLVTDAERPTLQLLRSALYANVQSAIEKADVFFPPEDHTALDQAWLNFEMNADPIINGSGDTIIDKTIFNSLWGAVYASVTALMGTMSKRGNDSAAEALNEIKTISSDSVLSKVEKPSVIRDMAVIDLEHLDLENRAASLTDALTARSIYMADLAELRRYLAAVHMGTDGVGLGGTDWSDTTTNSEIDALTFVSKFANYFSSRTMLLTAMTNAIHNAFTSFTQEANNALADAPKIVTGLPALPSPDYPSGKLVYETGTKQLFRSTGTAWEALVIQAANIAGIIQDAQIAALSATKIAGALTDAQVAGLSAAKLIGQVADAQIAGLATSKLAGTIANAQIAALDATKVTGTLTDAQIAGLSAAKLSGQITGTQITDGSISTPKMAVGSITAASGILADACIGTAKIVDGAISNAKIGQAAIGTAQIQDAAIVNAKIGNLDAQKINTGYLDVARLQAGSITAATGIIADATIGSAKIIDGSITNAKIANLAVGTAQIADAAIVSAKIGTLDASKITSGTISTDRLDVNQIKAGVLSVGAVGADQVAANAITAAKLAAELALIGDIRSSGASSWYRGDAGNAPVGFRLSGQPFYSTPIGGSPTLVNLELGTLANFGGYLVGNITNRTMTSYNRVQNGCFYGGFGGWFSSMSTYSVWDGSYPQTKFYGWGSVSEFSSTVAGGCAALGGMLEDYSLGYIPAQADLCQAFNVPPTTRQVLLTFATAVVELNNFGQVIQQPIIGRITPKIFNTTTGVETVYSTYEHNHQWENRNSPDWIERQIDITPVVQGGGDFVLVFQGYLGDYSTFGKVLVDNVKIIL